MKNIKKYSISILLILLLSQASLQAIELGKVALFGSGFLLGAIPHELGHAATGLALGGKVEGLYFNRTDVSFYGKNQDIVDAKIRATLLSGYASQSLVSELILQNKNWHKNDFALGLMTWGIVNNLSNVFQYYALNKTENDLGAYEKYGGNPAIPATLMVAYSAFAIYRIFHDTEITPYIGKNVFGLTVPIH